MIPLPQLNVFKRCYLPPLLLFCTAALMTLITPCYCMSININPRWQREILKGDDWSQTCSCSRPSFYPGTGWIRLMKLNNMLSSCSDVGTFFDDDQNVVSFSMHLEPNQTVRAQYLLGITLNLARMRKYYPGFTMRIYSDEILRMGSDFCKLWCRNPDLFWCDVRHSPSLGDISAKFYMLWRFTALGDPTVDTFLSRDLDSVITPSEVGAVRDWLTNSSKPIHSMRDNDAHCSAIMPGGMWGARNGLLARALARELQEQVLNISTSDAAYKGLDQDMLESVFMPRSEDILIHDSYCCMDIANELPQSSIRPFPTKRLNNQNDFVGNPEFGGGDYNLEPCPEECRPSYGKDWTYC